MNARKILVDIQQCRGKAASGALSIREMISPSVRPVSRCDNIVDPPNHISSPSATVTIIYHHRRLRRSLRTLHYFSEGDAVTLLLLLSLTSSLIDSVKAPSA
jgi:hypothetical protein